MLYSANPNTTLRFLSGYEKLYWKYSFFPCYTIKKCKKKQKRGEYEWTRYIFVCYDCLSQNKWNSVYIHICYEWILVNKYEHIIFHQILTEKNCVRLECAIHSPLCVTSESQSKQISFHWEVIKEISWVLIWLYNTNFFRILYVNEYTMYMFSLILKRM